MAEKDARLAINNAVEQLEQVSAIVQETRQLKSLKPGFRTMKCIVEELEGQENHRDEGLLQQVRDIAYETQDVIGSVVADTNLQRQSKLGRLLSGGKATKHVEEIENMKGRIQRVCSFKDVASSNKESNHGRSFSMSRNKEIVGFQDAKDTSERQLMDGAESQREVIRIHGKAGSGKTTLDRMICDECDDLSEAFKLLPEVQQFCLLYFGLIPAGLKIPAKQMIQMWMAEGLLKQKGSKRPEEIGEDYLNKLASQAFIQVTKDPNGSVKTCSTFGNVYDLCQTKGEDWKFFEVHKDNNSKPQKSIKRMAIHSDSVTEVLKSFGDCSHVHSLHCFGTTTKSTSIESAEFWKTLHHNFKNIQVLNLSCLEFDKVPKELGKMTKNLKYLRLNAPNVKNLPPSIVNLHQLETLDMRESPLIRLPHGIWKMQFLRHLYLGGSSFLPNTRGIDYYKTLSNLQILSGVQPDKELKWLMVRAKFPNVTKLRICSIDLNLTLNFLNSLDHLYHLRSLRVENAIKLDAIKLPNINAFPLNLTKVTLLETKLQPDCIKTLGELSSLRILKLLKDAIHGKEIASAGGFLQLEFLHIENLVVETWNLESGAMQGVKRFSIKGRDITHIRLETAPDYLRNRVVYLKNGTC